MANKKPRDHPLLSGALQLGATVLAPSIVQFLVWAPRATSLAVGGPLTILAAIEDPAVISKILTHLGLPSHAPPRAPARLDAFMQTAYSLPIFRFGARTDTSVALVSFLELTLQRIGMD